ncbi:MAG: EVE domain-containing protein [Sandaracinaceae bacterium]|nr:MAG: EVE domain-containing protein [Sandaracinaceae bacterium]
MAKRRYWLVKSEPDAYSIEDLERDGQAEWDGVRNYQARNSMRDEMTVGDLVLFYHSNAKPPGVAGVAKVATEAYPDPTQFDPKSKYHDPKATEEAPRWHLVDLSFVEKFDAVLGLDVLKEHADDLEGMMVIKRGIRFSVQPVEKEHFRKVLKLAGAKTKVR